ncbi:papain-like cysteine protease family protein [Chryseobacterium sp.]|uniref:papain-like cysteine protease family protein n=1 Tax=Chryseobacterium sp. TaxID=1871047 RepID=UPI00289EC7D6|nr:papain-like cysteine protease family protein [Chryseobacterium sp.]
MNFFSIKIKIFLNVFLLLQSINLLAQNKDKQGIFQLPDGTFIAAVGTVDFKTANIDNDLQRQDMWCWATCVAMTLRFQGLQVTQEDVVQKAFNILVNEPGTGNDMVKGANGRQINGKTIVAYVDNKINPKIIIDDLANKYPLVVGLSNPNQNVGHAYVLTAIYFTGDIQNNIYPIKVTLRDPWPYKKYNQTPPPNMDSKGRIHMSWNEFSSKVNTIVHITF